MSDNVFARMKALNPDTELWFDSSPLVFASWRREVTAKLSLPESGNPLDRFFQGEARDRVIDGSTTNPGLGFKAVTVNPGEEARWREWVRAWRCKHPAVPRYEAYLETYREVARQGAETLSPVLKASMGRRGYISCQLDPRLSDDPDRMVEQARFFREASPGIMIKFPGTKAGIEGIRRVTALGIPTNATLVFTVSQLLAVAEAVAAGLLEARRRGVDMSYWRSVATMMLGRFEDSKGHEASAAQAGVKLTPELRRWAGIAIAKRAYEIYRRNAWPTKLLLASMRIGPEVEGRPRIWHLEQFFGGDVVKTVFPNILENALVVFRDKPLEPHMHEPVPQAALQTLLRIPYFRQGYDPDGLKPEEWGVYPPVVETRTSFTQDAVAMEEWVARNL
ncbi:MAG: hypothetical protein HYU36_07285 [Planctomycetes bacterium]|nr:hypothetical protein [Planctomycetota bacterium]